MAGCGMVGQGLVGQGKAGDSRRSNTLFAARLRGAGRRLVIGQVGWSGMPPYGVVQGCHPIHPIGWFRGAWGAAGAWGAVDAAVPARGAVLGPVLV
jgi:hypothetical protein